ncbi:hypothetical protein ABZP36_033182 [Zizania latifolia]
MYSDSCRLSRISYTAPNNTGRSSESNGEVLLKSLGANTTGIEGYRNHGFLRPFKKVQYAASNSSEEIQVLSSECSEEARKVEHALQEEEALKQVAADEKVKHLEAIEEVEQAKKSFTREAYSRN